MCRDPVPRSDETKQLLDIIGHSTLQTGIEVYEAYLKKALHTRINLNSLISASAGSPRILEGFYAVHDEKCPPKYFSLYNLAALTQLQQKVLTGLDRALVILYCKEPVEGKGQEGDYFMFYDGRVQAMRNGDVALTPLVVIIRPEAKNRRPRYLKEASPEFISKLEIGLFNYLHNLHDITAVETCPTVGTAFARIFNEPQLQNLNWTDTLLKLPQLPPSGKSITLLCYYGSNISVKSLASSKDLANAHFHRWGQFWCGPSAHAPEEHETVVVSPFYTPTISPAPYSVALWTISPSKARAINVKLAPKQIPYDAPVINNEALQMIGSASKKRRDNTRIHALMRRKFKLLEERNNILALNPLDPFDDGEDETCPRMFSAEDTSPLCKIEEELDEIDNALRHETHLDCNFTISSERWSCCCSYCTSSFTDDNWRDANPSGPNRPILYPDTSPEFLRLLNMDTPDFRERIKKACRLSVATYDLETYSNYNKGNITSAMRISSITDKDNLSEDVHATLVPEMIGFCCNGVTKTDYEAFSVAKEEPDERGMMLRFITHLFKKKEEMEELKRDTLRPILDSLEHWRLAHMKSFPEDSNISSTTQEVLFRNSPAGKFRSHLERMIKGLFVFGFNSSSFDNVAIFPHLAMYIKSNFSKTRFHTQCDGYKIKKILCPGKGLIVSDAKFFLSAGASLAQMLRTVLDDKTCEKGIFPHGLFTSRDFLTKAELPPKASEWLDPLHPDRVIPQEAVDEAIMEFKRQKCRTIGDYEHYYMKLDTVLLKKATDNLFDAFEDIVGLHAIDCRKLSISSLAAAGVQMELRRKKSYAYYSPNCRPLLKALVDSATGGEKIYIFLDK